MAKAKKTVDAGEPVECLVKSPLKYEGDRYDPGETVILPASLHAELEAAGVVGPLPAKATKAQPAKDTTQQTTKPAA